MASLSKTPNGQLTGARPHILGVPFETRLAIYGYILDDVQNESRQWERNAFSAYDGLLLACRQLSHEANQFVFPTRVTRHQSSKLAKLAINRSTFFSLRSLCIEIDLELDVGDLGNLAKALNFFQLSLQELHLLFFGQDRHGNKVSASGCSNEAMCLASSRPPLLLESGQDTEKKLNLLRTLTRCRNLRILRIENINLPLLPAIFMADKPFLQVFSATCDHRSITHSYARWKNRRDMLRGLLIKVDTNRLPPIRALSLDANAVVPAEDVVQWLKGTLQHLSWRVPNPDYQGHPTRQNDFYDMTDTIFRSLWSADRAPQLETLRLCCDMRDLPANNAAYQRDMGHLVAALSSDLPRFPKLKHFEIHYSGGDNFIRDFLIEALPHGLQRLYISDMTITMEQLVGQVRKRYLSNAHGLASSLPVLALNPVLVNGGTDGLGEPRIQSIPLHEVPTSEYIFVDDKGQVKYLSATEAGLCGHGGILVVRAPLEQPDYLGDHCMRGESKFRRDVIPLNTGKLGFIGFEYDNFDSHGCIDHSGEKTNRTGIFRLNGQLLDREHNLHLAYVQSSRSEYGIEPPQAYGPPQENSDLPETETYSKHSEIYAAIYSNADLAPNSYLVEQNRKELAACPQCNGEREEPGSMAWYFGNENEAMEIFEQEPVAKLKDQRQKSTLLEVAVLPTTRCRWMCPDFEMPPVGSFPVPPVPSDWQTLARAR